MSVAVKRAKPHVFRYAGKWLLMSRIGSVFVLSDDLRSVVLEDVPPGLLYESVSAPVLSRETLL